MSTRFGKNLTASYVHTPKKKEEEIYFPGSRLTEGADLIITTVRSQDIKEYKVTIAANAQDYAYMENIDRSRAHCPKCKLSLSSAALKIKICNHCEHNFRKTGPITKSEKSR